MTQTEHELSVLKETPGISKDIRLFFVTIIYWLIENIAKVDIDQESQDNLKALDEQLKTSSVVMYGYHSSVLDSIILPIVLRKHLNNLDTMIAPVAITHATGIQKDFLDIIGSRTNSQFIPVIRKQDEANYDSATKKELLRKFIEITKEKLSEEGNILGVAPMGARRKVLRKKDMNPGFMRAAQKSGVDLVAVTLTKNKFRSFKFRIGKSMPAPHKSVPIYDAAHEAIKNGIAPLLEKKPRGDYA